MFHVKVSLFSHTKELEHKIDELHDKIVEISMVFKKAVHLFLQEKRSDNYRKLSKEISEELKKIYYMTKNNIYVKNFLNIKGK